MVGAISAAGLMGGLAMVLAQLQKQQLTLQKKIQSSIEVQSLTDRITRILYDRDACLNTIGSGTDLSATTPISLTSIKNKRDADAIKVANANGKPSYGNRLIKVNSIELDNIDLTAAPAGRLDLTIVMEKTSRAVKGQRTVSKTFKLAVQVNTANQPTLCESDLSAALRQAQESICRDLGGTFDTINRTCETPTANKTCPPGDLPTGFDASGNLVCQTPPGGLAHPTGYNCFVLTVYQGNHGMNNQLFQTTDNTPLNDLQRLERWKLNASCGLSDADLAAAPGTNYDVTSPPTRTCTIGSNSYSVSQCPTGYRPRFINPLASPYNQSGIPGAYAAYMEQYCCK